MYWITFSSFLLACSTAIIAGRGLEFTGSRFSRVAGRAVRVDEQPDNHLIGRDAPEFQFLNDKTRKFAVNGSAIPDVSFDAGESYAGSLPISSKEKEESQLFFWFFPSTNPAAKKEIVIWLNGGPGCSSLEGFLQENGPFMWQYGTFRPVRNQWGWNTLTNIIWVDQPVGTGFSTGKVTAKDENDVAAQFMGFWKNFIDTFGMKGYKIYITGESYAGYYCPYIANAFLDAKDDAYYNVSGVLLYDAVIAPEALQSLVPAVAYTKHWPGFFPFNDTFRASLSAADEKCGFTSHMKKHIVYPPAGVQKMPGTFENGTTRPECAQVFQDVNTAVSLLNPCFNVYQIATTCPLLWDVLGFPGSTIYTPEGATVYFDRVDVKEAIHAPPNVKWAECADRPVFVDGVDKSEQSGFSVLPRVIDQTQNVIIGHGSLDFRLTPNGTLLAIQNMTWGGKMGFQKQPTTPFYVPHSTMKPLAAAGVMGTKHTERGLTYVEIAMTGHMVPQYAPSASYRHLEVLLGRVKGLDSTEPFTTNRDVQQSQQKLGRGLRGI